VNYAQPETPLTPDDVVAAVIQSAITESDGRERLRYDGIAGSNADTLLAIAGMPIEPSQALTLYNRWRAGLAKVGRLYDESWVRQALSESRLKLKYNDAIVDLADQFLGAADYIRFGVRDAYDDAVAKRDRTDEDFPATLGPTLRALGYRDEDARAAWRAHWELPSPTQAYEMLHRGLITKDDLADYLRQADYAPRWRPLLEAISYSPLTRVDVRRAYKLGVVTLDQVRQTYKDLGYDDTNADILAKFTAEDADTERRQERELLVGPIKAKALALYQDRRLTEANLRNVLANLGYATELVDRYIADIEFVRIADERNEISGAIKAAYVRGLRSRDDTINLLGLYGWESELVDELLTVWDVLRTTTELQPHQLQTRDLTKTEVVSAYSEGITTGEDARASLLALGYDDSEVATIIALADLKRSKAFTNERIENIHLNYLRGGYDASSASVALDQLGITAHRRQNLLMQWEVELARRTPDFTITQLEAMVKARVMPEDRAQQFLRDQGYTNEQQTYLLSWWLGKRQMAQQRG
jgi:hypothetical protein